MCFTQVLILPHIAFEGLDHEDACVKKENFYKITDAKIQEIVTAGARIGNGGIYADLRKLLSQPAIDMEAVAKKLANHSIETFNDGAATDGEKKFYAAFKKGAGNIVTEFDRTQTDFMPRIYRGYSTRDATTERVITTNTGHLGAVDSVEHCNRVWGTAGGQIYKRRPTGN